MAADGFETKREVRRLSMPPSWSAPLAEREAWAIKFLPRFFELTGGEWPEPPEAIDDGGGAYLGRRWRAEFSECVRDPQRFQEYAEREIADYGTEGV
jgi:hypothetical protein